MSINKVVQLNLGCGDQRLEGFFGLDRLPRQGTDLICDLERGIPIAANSVNHIYAKSVLEHLANLEPLLREILRALKPGGTVYIYVPHWSNPFYYSDYTHRRFFGLATFDYFANADEQIYRSAPTYSDIRFQTLSVRLLFKSPFFLFHWLLKGVQWIINRHPRWQLFFEYHLAGVIPCYAVEYRLQKRE